MEFFVFFYVSEEPNLIYSSLEHFFLQFHTNWIYDVFVLYILYSTDTMLV